MIFLQNLDFSLLSLRFAEKFCYLELELVYAKICLEKLWMRSLRIWHCFLESERGHNKKLRQSWLISEIIGIFKIFRAFRSSHQPELKIPKLTNSAFKYFFKM